MTAKPRTLKDVQDRLIAIHFIISQVQLVPTRPGTLKDVLRQSQCYSPIHSAQIQLIPTRPGTLKDIPRQSQCYTLSVPGPTNPNKTWDTKGHPKTVPVLG